MSRVGKNPVTVPEGVSVEITGPLVTARGRLGELSYEFVDAVEVKLEDGNVWVTPRNKSKRARLMWGTTRSRISNLVRGVDEGFRVDLEIIGVGYRAAVQGDNLSLQLGFSHDINLPIPEGITITCAKPTSISVFGADRQKVGQVASDIRKFRKPEPYKGKGIKYKRETILRKEGKKK